MATTTSHIITSVFLLSITSSSIKLTLFQTNGNYLNMDLSGNGLAENKKDEIKYVTF